MNEKVILIPVSEKAFKNMLEEVVRKVLNGKEEKPSDKAYLNVEEAAELIQLAPQTIYGLTSRRLIPFVKKGHKLRFIKEDLENWLLEGKKKTLDELE